MGIKSTAVSCVRGFVRLPVIAPVFQHPRVRQIVHKLPGGRGIYGMGWDRRHPFDAAHGTDTSGFVAMEAGPGGQFVGHYSGSQPSIIRAALRALPPLQDFTFIDLGCGKGRPLIIASEFPFKQAIGVELNPDLAACGRKNLEIFRAHSPGACAMEIEMGDAVEYPFPPGDLVVFLYNSFGEVLVRRTVANIEKTLAVGGRQLFLVYYNPVHAHCFDASLCLNRFFAANVPYATDELGFGPDLSDTVVIWQAGDAVPAKPGADANVIVTKTDVRAELA